MRTVIPREVRMRASAASEPHPSPSALMWVEIATERPARNSRARRSIASLLSFDTVRRSTTRFDGSADTRVRLAVYEVDQEANREPHKETDPCVARKAVHHVTADRDREDWHDRHEWSPERPRKLRALSAKNDDSCRNDHEGKQCSDRNQLAEQTDREESCDDSADDTGENRCDVRRLELRMNLPEHRRKQPVTRHRE